MKVGICPHDVVHDPDKWTVFTKYVLKKMSFSGSFEKYFSFETFAQQFTKMNLIYAHPLHAVHLQEDLNFKPLVRYQKKYDEAVIIYMKNNNHKTVKDIKSNKVSCVLGSPSHAAVLLDFNQNNLSIDFEAVNRSSYPEVLATVISRDAQFGIILKEVWEAMRASHPTVEVLYTTYTKKLFHSFMLAPNLMDHHEDFRKILLNMNHDPEGKAILERLGCHKLESTNEQDIENLGRELASCKFRPVDFT